MLLWSAASASTIPVFVAQLLRCGAAAAMVIASGWVGAAGAVSVKDNLRGGAASAGVAHKASSVKSALQAQPSALTQPSKPATPAFVGGCGYFTKPMVRPDGAGTNTHAVGSLVCHEATMWECDDGEWKRRSLCRTYSPAFVEEVRACRLESTPCSEGDDDPDAAGGNTGPGGGGATGAKGGANRSAQPQGSGSDAPGGAPSGLLGQDPEEAALERRRLDLERRQSLLSGGQQNQRGASRDVGGAGAGSAGAGGAGGSTMGAGASAGNRCAAQMQQIDQRIKARFEQRIQSAKGMCQSLRISAEMYDALASELANCGAPAQDLQAVQNQAENSRQGAAQVCIK